MSLLVLEHSDRCRCGRLAATLRDHGHILDVRGLHNGDTIPTDLEGIDGIITMGGPMSPSDDSQPWMQSELELLAKAASMDLPILGICLGCQLLARALGGEVERRPHGPRLGWAHIDLSSEGREDRLFAGLPWKWSTAHWNSWQISQLPQDACLLAQGSDGDVQAWRAGVRVYGLQFHPEIAQETLKAWIEDEPEVLKDAGISETTLLEQTQSEWPAFQRLTDRMFKACALLLFPLEQRTLGNGVIQDIHH